MLVWSPTMVLKVRKVITMLEECCPWSVLGSNYLHVTELRNLITK